MTIAISAKCASQAIHSTSAIYHIVKATMQHGEPAVITKMALIEQKESNLTYHEAVKIAAIRHEEIMTLSTKSEKYKTICEDLNNVKNDLPYLDLSIV